MNTPTADSKDKTRVCKWRMVSLSAIAFSDCIGVPGEFTAGDKPRPLKGLLCSLMTVFALPGSLLALLSYRPTQKINQVNLFLLFILNKSMHSRLPRKFTC